MASEIVLRATSPETEWIRDRPVRKVSPTRDHSRVRAALTAALYTWAAGRGEIGTEWRFRIEPPGEVRRPLVPDIAYVAYDKLRGFSREELQAPPFAPSVAIEILSPGDRPADVAAKVSDYLQSGSALVIVIDPSRRSAGLYEPGQPPRLLSGDTTLRHDAALPGFDLPLQAFFADALDVRP